MWGVHKRPLLIARIKDRSPRASCLRTSCTQGGSARQRIALIVVEFILVSPLRVFGVTTS